MSTKGHMSLFFKEEYPHLHIQVNDCPFGELLAYFTSLPLLAPQFVAFYVEYP